MVGSEKSWRRLQERLRLARNRPNCCQEYPTKIQIPHSSFKKVILEFALLDVSPPFSNIRNKNHHHKTLFGTMTTMLLLMPRRSLWSTGVSRAAQSRRCLSDSATTEYWKQTGQGRFQRPIFVAATRQHVGKTTSKFFMMWYMLTVISCFSVPYVFMCLLKQYSMSGPHVRSSKALQ